MIIYDKYIEIKTERCLDCLSLNVTKNYEWQELPKQDDWKDTRFLMPYIECNDCGSKIEAPEADIVMHDAACKAQGLLTPSEIVELRNEYELSQKDFSEFLGLGGATIARWESRKTFPNKAYDILLKILMNVPQAKTFLKNLNSNFSDEGSKNNVGQVLNIQKFQLLKNKSNVEKIEKDEKKFNEKNFLKK